MQIRTGLHILGRIPTERILKGYLLAVCRVNNGHAESLNNTIAAAMGYDYHELFERSAAVSETGVSGAAALAEIQLRCEQFIDVLLAGNFSAAAAEQALSLPWLAEFAATAQEELRRTAKYICGELVQNLQGADRELGNIVRALDGEYIEPGPAGAPTSGMVEVLPTGRNFYGVDPATLPTSVGWQLGVALGNGVIAEFIAAKGKYPENIGIIMWCGANMRSRGQCIAEILYLLGMKPVWQPGSRRVVGIEVIPLSELKRPRIDITVRISGLFRDAMPGVVEWLDKAVKTVQALPEAPDDNYPRKHFLTDTAELAATGMSAEKAAEQAAYRIFGCAPGAYGAGVSNMLEEKNWETAEDLGNTYVRWGGHAYGGGKIGDYVPQLFKKRLSQLEVTIKNEDNREATLLDSDDFNSYHGGMVAAVRAFRGEAPLACCGDSSDRQNPVVRTLQAEFKRIFRGEVLNPKHIEGLKQHGYKGAADMAGTVARCYDWDATSLTMENWMYNALTEKYVFDKELQDWMMQENPWAMHRIVEKLLEAAQRNMWQADEQVIDRLQEMYLSIEGELEERSD